MKRIMVFACGLGTALLLMGGNCSRARVESMNLMNEGVVFAQQKRFSDAAERLERAVSVDPTNDQALYNLAQVHIDLRKFERARDDLNKAIAVNGQVASYHEKLGTVFIELENWAGAKESLSKALELDASLCKGYYKLAQVLEKLDDPQNALRRYTDALQKCPGFLEGYSALGRLYADLGFTEQATQVLQGGLQVAEMSKAGGGTEEQANLHHFLGTVYQQRQEYDKAIAEFEKAVQIVPGMPEALFSLGWACYLQQKVDCARRYLRKFVDVGGAEAQDHYLKAARDCLAEMEGGP